jgi:hypothetical protein
MRCIHYPFNEKLYRKTLKLRIELLSKEQRRSYKIQKTLNNINITFYFAMITSLIILYKTVIVKMDVSDIVMLLLTILIWIVGIVLPIVICVFLFQLYNKRYQDITIPPITKEIIEECVKPLKRFYKIKERYIITKCFDCTKKHLVDKDVILFIYKDKLRISNDFTKSIKDFGCYEFKYDEIKLYYDKKDNQTVTIIECKEFKMILGKKAKPFISQNLLKKLIN